MKSNRIMVALAVCLLLTACGKDKQPVPPKPVDSAKPALEISPSSGSNSTPPNRSFQHLRQSGLSTSTETFEGRSGL